MDSHLLASNGLGQAIDAAFAFWVGVATVIASLAWLILLRRRRTLQIVGFVCLLGLGFGFARFIIWEGKRTDALHDAEAEAEAEFSELD